VRSAVRERWGEVLVDEFHDVNPLQARLVDLVRAPSRLFVVGDPKQSIYGFRGSAVEVFDECRSRVATADLRGEVTLAASFRSRPEVLDVVNRVFAEDFPLGTPLAAARSFAARQAACAEVFTVSASDLEEGRAAEAAWIARRIASLVEGPERLQVAAPTEADPFATRPAEFGDVAVLLRATTGIKVLERALTAQDVPYAVFKGRGFFEAREVVDLANLLEVVDNPRDDLTLAAVLRSPACGLTDDGLFALCRARGGARQLVDVLEDDRPTGLPARDRMALRRFLAVFGELRAVRAWEPLSVLVDRALAATRLETLCLTQVNGRQRAANLRKVRTLARRADADAAGGRAELRGFLRSLRELREREVRETEAPASGGADGAVKLLTVHAAKGLEFPIVFVPDLGRVPGAERSAVTSHAQDGLGLRSASPVGPLTDVTPWAFRTIRERNEQRELAEEHRLLYVAMTRAEEHLVLTTSLTPRSSGQGVRRAPWWNRVSAALGLADGGAAPAGVLVHPPAEAAPHGRAATRTLLHSVAPDLARGRLPQLEVSAESGAEAERLVAEARRPLPRPDGTAYATTVSALVAFARCPQEFRLRHVLAVPESLAGPQDAEESLSESAPSPGRDDEWGVPLSARALGRAAHLALERLVPEFAVDVAAQVRSALVAESRGAAADPDQVERVASWVRGFADSDLGREVRSLPRDRVRREQALLFPVAPGERTVVRGQMDLVYRGARGWVVVDYKAGAAAFSDDAVLQMRLYALALEAITGEAPSRLVLFSLPESQAIEVPCSRDDVASLRTGLVAEFVARTRTSDLAPRAAPPCVSCAYRRRCAFAR
jgi:ATP-dependent helicase/nuclease subunit A